MHIFVTIAKIFVQYIFLKRTRASIIEGNFLHNDHHFRGEVNINCIYYTIFSKVLCLTFCQIPSPYQDSHMQIRSGSPEKNASLGNSNTVSHIALNSSDKYRVNKKKLTAFIFKLAA